ncbi:ubiquitin protein ligase [Sistotremastrum suecicum HHB10207 ss-3]|uniref:HECT-type E3 ubiquitin transferase n=1 Tax=Sistotremastrum suecicum HHB10207 ss-3 TaxID=1314776 RepID=A0A166JDK7_9AGAM|nr:ubiquitin protein ligase [Sistotremastrum suecicum HHB10207 ss-3]
MIPFLGDSGRRRNINLGGKTAASHASILDQAKTQRLERETQRRKYESAIKVQAWYRGRSEARRAKAQMQRDFDAGSSPHAGARYLALFGQEDEYRLNAWSLAVIKGGDAALFGPFTAADAGSWQILLQRLSLVLLRTVSRSPESPSALNHLKILDALLSVSTFKKALPFNGENLCLQITSYLLRHDFFRLIREGYLHVPPERKTAPFLPPWTALALSPLSTFSNPSDFANCLIQFLGHVLTVPLIPNRLPLPSVTYLAIHLPISRLDQLPLPEFLTSFPSLESRAHLIANLSTFAYPRFSKVSGPVIQAYLSLISGLMETLPLGCFEIEKAKKADRWGAEEPDTDDDEIPVAVQVTSFELTPSIASLRLDQRTLNRLQAIQSPAHLQPLLAASSKHPSTRIALCNFILNLCDLMPSKRNNVLGSMAATGSGGLIREIYRGWVRVAPLGKDESTRTWSDPQLTPSWVTLLILTELFNHILLTMGDDEFFASAAPNATGARNPLTLDEVVAFSRQLLNVVFALFTELDQRGLQQQGIRGLRMTWEMIRERGTQCLQAIHSRDSRRPFVPTDHWLRTGEMDLKTFVEAALAEEDDLVAGARTLTKRQLALLSPRLGILNNIPFAIPFDTRVSIFRRFVANDQAKHPTDPFDRRASRTRVSVRRGKIAQDGFDHLADADLKGEVQISFIDQFGNEEAGIDGGGVFKEFLTSLSKEVFDSDRGLWLETGQRELYPNPHSYATEPHSLNWFRFVGRILGKALYEGILVDIAFAPFFLAKWLKKQSFLDDLASLDPELYRGLIHLKHDPNPEALSLDFTVTLEELGVARTIDLIPDGSNIPVTRQNRLQYIYLVSNFHLNKKIRLQCEAFFDGLASMVDPKWLRMFNQQELQLLVSGANSPIDIDDLRENTQYGGVYDDDEETIRLFWKVLKSFDQDQCRALLRFVTSCSRPPLLGFKELYPKFCIRDSSNDESRLPTSSTCVNLLKLPRYKSEAILRQKILQAVTSGAGFDLS